MKVFKRVLSVLLAIILVWCGIFVAGRYGWKLAGFQACEGAGISNITVDEDAVHIRGFYPGSFPEGFCGYYAQERDGVLYVGFRFSAIFGFFETGDFAVWIPVTDEIHQVVLKTRLNETVLWDAQEGHRFQQSLSGVFVRTEREDVFAIGMTYEQFSGGGVNAGGMALEQGAYIHLDNDIMQYAKETESPIPFTITVRGESGSELAQETFQFEASKERMYLTVTADGRIVEDN